MSYFQNTPSTYLKYLTIIIMTHALLFLQLSFLLLFHTIYTFFPLNLLNIHSLLNFFTTITKAKT